MCQCCRCFETSSRFEMSDLKRLEKMKNKTEIWCCDYFSALG